MAPNTNNAANRTLLDVTPDNADERLIKLQAQFTILRDGYRERANLIEAYAEMLGQLGDQATFIESEIREQDDDLRRKLRNLGYIQTRFATSLDSAASGIRAMENSYRGKANEYRRIATDYEESRLRAVGMITLEEERQSVRLEMLKLMILFRSSNVQYETRDLYQSDYTELERGSSSNHHV